MWASTLHSQGKAVCEASLPAVIMIYWPYGTPKPTPVPAMKSLHGAGSDLHEQSGVQTHM